MKNKTKFATIFSKSKGITSRVIAIILMLAINVVAFSQEISQVGYNYVLTKSGDTIDNHSTFRKAIQTAINQPKNEAKDTLYITTPRIRVVIDAIQHAYKETVVDTLLLTRCGVINQYIHQESGVYIAFGSANIGMALIEMDTLYKWQMKYEIERTINYNSAARTYKSLKIPFQYMDIHFVKYDSTRTDIYVKITEKQVRITAWLDNEIYIEFNPGSSSLNINEIGYNYWFGIKNLIEGKEYSFKLETENEKGEIAIYQTVIRI